MLLAVAPLEESEKKGVPPTLKVCRLFTFYSLDLILNTLYFILYYSH